MKIRRMWLAALAALLFASPALVAAQPKEMFIPLLVYRTGPYAPSGIPIADGFVDYFTLLNERDGGINGVKVAWEECETQYDNKQGVECYERLKGKSPVLVNPYSTAITYSLIPKAPVDKVVVFSMGYGMSAASDGRWFPWVFNFPTNYWSQASAVIRYIGQQEGGLEKLRGKKIVHIFHNSAYGKEANPTLEELSKKYQFELTLLAVDHPGQEQKATWLQVRRLNPDWIFMSGWGVITRSPSRRPCPSASRWTISSATGGRPTISDVVRPARAPRATRAPRSTRRARATRCTPTSSKYVYDKGKGSAKKEEMGAPLYNRGIVNAMLSAEAIRTAMAKFGNKPLTGEQVRWGFENLNLTDQRLEQVGMRGFMHSLKVTCEDHEGSGPVLIQQWDGKKWSVVTDWIAPMREVVRPKIEAAAVDEAKKLNYAMRDCAKEK
jgi:branched-chain amino acid transport system substrate-binding protein